jgi:hypothetical protein
MGYRCVPPHLAWICHRTVGVSNIYICAKNEVSWLLPTYFTGSGILSKLRALWSATVRFEMTFSMEWGKSFKNQEGALLRPPVSEDQGWELLKGRLIKHKKSQALGSLLQRIRPMTKTSSIHHFVSWQHSIWGFYWAHSIYSLLRTRAKQGITKSQPLVGNHQVIEIVLTMWKAYPALLGVV